MKVLTTLSLQVPDDCPYHRILKLYKSARFIVLVHCTLFFCNCHSWHNTKLLEVSIVKKSDVITKSYIKWIKLHEVYPQTFEIFSSAVVQAFSLCSPDRAATHSFKSRTDLKHTLANLLRVRKLVYDTVSSAGCICHCMIWLVNAWWTAGIECWFI
jgi:hypothetical protein